MKLNAIGGTFNLSFIIGLLSEDYKSLDDFLPADQLKAYLDILDEWGELAAATLTTIDVGLAYGTTTVAGHLPKNDCINHLSIYVANLLTLRLMFDGSYVIDYKSYGDIDIWERILHLWRYSFSDKDYIRIVSLFHAHRRPDSCQLVYENHTELYDTFYETNLNNRLNQLYAPALRLGDELICGLSGALIGTSGDKISTLLHKLNLRAESQNRLHEMLSCLCNGSENKNSISNSLANLRSACLTESHESILLAYYLILHRILAVSKIKTLPTKASRKLAKTIVCDVNWLFRNSSSDGRLDQLVHLSDLCIDLISYLDLRDKKTTDNIYRLFLVENSMPNIDYIYYWVQFYNKISQVNTPLFPEQNQYVFQKKHIDIITQMKYILSRTPYQLMDDDKYITAFLEFILTLFKQDNSLAATLLKTYIEVYPEMVSNSFYPTTTQCIYLTSCLYYFRISLGFENWIVSDSSAPYKVSRVLCQIVDVLSVTEMYQYSPELAYHFMWIIDLLPSYQNKIAHELKNIVVRYKKSLSLEFVQQLQYLSSSLSGEASHSLKKAIETL